MFAYNTYKQAQTTIIKNSIVLPNPPLPEGLLGIFQGGLLFYVVTSFLGNYSGG